MSLFYNFLDLLHSSGNSGFEDKKTFKITFQLSQSILENLSFELLFEMKKDYDNNMNFYFINSMNMEEDFFDYLGSEKELEEVKDRLDQSYKFKLILDKSKFIKNKINVDANLVYFVESSTFNEFIIKGVNFLEETLFLPKVKSIFVLGDNDEYFRNEFYFVTNLHRINFLSEITKFNEAVCDLDIESIMDIRHGICNWINGSNFIIPDTLYVNMNNSEFIISDSIKKYIIKAEIDIIIPFISNFTGHTSGNYLSVISGNKRIEIVYDLNLEEYTEEAYTKLFNLYKWIYEKSTFDKMNICRNVISILVSAKCQGSTYKTIIQNSDWLVKSVQDNFEDFLQQNIQAYFNEKNTIINKLSENINGVNNQISELTKLTVTNMTSLLGTAIAAVIGYIAKGDVIYIRMLSALYLCFLLVNSVFNLPISFIRAIQCKNDFKYNKEMYIKIYLRDGNIDKMVKRNGFNLVAFYFYVALTCILILGITMFLVKTDINKFIEKFKG